MRSPCAVIILLVLAAVGAWPAGAAPGDELVGLWKAQRSLGPPGRGPLIIERSGLGYVADMAGHVVRAKVEGNRLSFALPNNAGAFRGVFTAQGTIAGHWFPANATVSPVHLMPAGTGRWNGTVAAFEDPCTFWLKIEKKPDGTFSALLRNFERDLGSQMGVTRVAMDAKGVSLFGKRDNWKEEREVAHGAYDPEIKVLALFFQNAGGAYNFQRDGDDSDFYPRGLHPARYAYRPPPARDDGWPTTTLAQAGIDQTGIEHFVQTIIDAPMDAPGSLQIHAILIARHGKLVLEEYFHGFNRDTLHNTRSAAKVVTATIVGAAMNAGTPLQLSTPVYKAMNSDTFPSGLEPMKQAMTLESLMTMSSGYFCDDNNDDAPGNEETMQDQTAEPDYYKFTLRLPMVTPPGEKAVYCSINPNLELGVVGHVTGEFPPALFDRLLGVPMKIERYLWPLDPAGNPYGGGGAQFLPRDFMKFGQLMLNGGTWAGKRLLAKDFVARASSHLYHLWGIYYGYHWWGIDFPYKNRTVHAFFAGGAGGQAVIVLPELDLVVATFAGNFASPGTKQISQELTPQFILPAVREPGDDMSAPVAPLDYHSPCCHPELPSPRVGSEK